PAQPASPRLGDPRVGRPVVRLERPIGRRTRRAPEPSEQDPVNHRSIGVRSAFATGAACGSAPAPAAAGKMGTRNLEEKRQGQPYLIVQRNEVTRRNSLP